MDILSKEEFTQEDIDNIISSKLEESINIEFKSCDSLSFKESDKKEISKDVSAFANSDGGIIFYGINEESHIAASTSFIDGLKFTKEWLENVIISNIQQRIVDLKIIPIRYENDFQKTIYIVKIPKSPHFPHINGDKKYYKRFNFQSIPMEEYEVRNSYLKDHDCQIEVNGILAKFLKVTDKNFEIRIEIQVVNNNYGIAEKYKIACDILESKGYSLNFDRELEYNITHKDKNIKISATKSNLLFPNEILNALCFNLLIPKNDFEEIAGNMKLNVIVFSLEILSQTEYEIGNMLLDIKNDFEQNASH